MKKKDMGRNPKKLHDITELSIEQAVLKGGRYHSDYFAHLLRWSHVLKKFPRGASICDVGCGVGELAWILYKNLRAPSFYLGIDISKGKMKSAREKFDKIPWAYFKEGDVSDSSWNADLFTKAALGILSPNPPFNFVTSFEVLEHVGKPRVRSFLRNLADLGDNETTFMLSTPNFDPRVGAAQNHIYGGIINEWDHQELWETLCERFTIIKKFGTFASQRDYKDLIIGETKILWEALHEYHQPSVLSVMFAPLFPERARNCLWVMKKGRSDPPKAKDWKQLEMFNKEKIQEEESDENDF
jgi:2-polyprenyl-3-methyl-5-hydroxy-6-metoxy-1,4-benzoquinol methylase